MIIWSCSKPELPGLDGYTPPPGFPEMEVPIDNAFQADRVALGKALFFDPILSADSTRACASCHIPAFAFSDTVAFSLGIEDRPGTRNSPSLANVGYQVALLREGGVPTLEMQILVPIQEHLEFDTDILVVAKKVGQVPYYKDLAMKAYGREPDPWVVTRAIAAFERTLISGNSRFDRWSFQGDWNALSPGAVRGLQLFQSDRLGCTSCHSGILLTDQSFANNGLYEEYADPGRYRLTGKESDRAVFKVPSLRNVAITAPYMHDGSLKDLSAVVQHYQTGIKDHPNKSPLLRSVQLTDGETNDLLDFLESLTDDPFLHDPHFQSQ
ncbi:MAG: c-type cytochrome [Saprospiraceae bacterium]|nr:c-type cytochrome [Saprospiraceae bacterium]